MNKRPIVLAGSAAALAGAILFAPALFASAFFGPNATPLQKAHEAYALGDFKRMTSAMKGALEESQDPAVIQNVTNLLRRAYDAKAGSPVPVDWKLPAELPKARIAVVRRESEGVKRYLKFLAHEQEKGQITQVQIKHYPDTVIVDLQAGIGVPEETPEIDDGKPTVHFQISGERGSEPLAAGLYTLRIALKSGSVTEGWFLLDSSFNSSASPVVHSPSMGEVFQTPNPVLKWDDFRSPEYQNHQRRVLWTGVYEAATPDSEWVEKWSYYQEDPQLTELAVGTQGPESTGGDALEPGRYVSVVQYVERERFGDLVISRDSTVTRPFFVKK
jgi:hypothetical protein